MAELRPVPQQPLVIAGPPGAGKTRLLNQVAQALRNRPEDILLACLSPLHFAEDVAALLRDPAPLRRAAHAVLLVDALDRFPESEQRLDPLMRQFMNHGGYVVVTSRAHPWGLTNIREGLRLVLSRGQVVEVGAPAAAPARPANHQRYLDELIASARKQSEVASLASNRLHSAIAAHREIFERASALFDKANEEVRNDRERLERARGRLWEVRSLLEELTERPETAQAVATTLARRALALVQRAVYELDMSIARAGERDELLDALARVQKRQQLGFANLVEHRRTASAEAAALRALTGWLEDAVKRAEAECAAVSGALSRVLAVGEKRLRVRGGARALATRVMRLQETKEVAEDRARRLVEQLTQRQESLLRARMELQALSEHNEVLQAELETHRHHVTGLKDRVAAQSREITHLREARAVARAEADRAEASATDLRTQLEKALEERTSASMRLRLAEGDRAALVRQLAQMKQERDRDRAARLHAESALRTLRRPAVTHKATPQPIGLDTPALRDDETPKEEQGIVSFAEERRKKRLGELLCESGRITRDQLDEALRLQGDEKPVRVGAILVARGYIDEETVVETVARQLGVVFLRLDRARIIPAAARLVDAAEARKHQCIPLSRQGSELTLAMADPLNQEAIAMIEQATQLKVRVVAAPPADIARAQETCYAA